MPVTLSNRKRGLGEGNCLANATFSLRAEVGKTKARAMNFVSPSRERGDSAADTETDSGNC